MRPALPGAELSGIAAIFRAGGAGAATAAPGGYADAGGRGAPAAHGGWGQGFGSAHVQRGPVMPAGIDEREFLAGAKALYTRLQDSWDRRDLDDISRFASPEVQPEIARQAGLDPSPGRTEILMLEARILEARTAGAETVISVLFDAMLREDGPDSTAGQVREVWHVSRRDDADRPQWTLEGIQQLDV